MLNPKTVLAFRVNTIAHGMYTATQSPYDLGRNGYLRRLDVY